MVGKTKDGTIYFDVYYQDADGILRRHREQSKKWKTLKDGKAAEQEFLAQQVKDDNMLFSVLFEKYLAHQKATKSTSTITHATMTYNNYLTPFHNLPVSKINNKIISEWQIDLLSKGYKNSTLIKIQKVLRACLNFGVKYDYIRRNPFTIPYIQNRIEQKQEMQTWTIAEFNQFLSVIDNPIEKAMFETLFYSACRIGELMALEIADYNGRSITINKQILKDGTLSPVKNKNGNRVVPLPKRLCQQLDEIIRECYLNTGKIHNWLFCGLPYASRKQVDYAKNKYCKMAGVKQIRLHDFRHSMATYLLADNKFTYKDVADFIGDDVKTVIDTYGHAYGDLHNRIQSVLDTL